MSQRYAIRWASKSGRPLYLREAVGRRQWMIYLEDASSFDWATGNRVLDALEKPEDGRFGMVDLSAPRGYFPPGRDAVSELAEDDGSAAQPW